MKNSGCHGNCKKYLLVQNPESCHIWHVASSSGALTKTSNYGPGVEVSPMLWGAEFDIEIKKESFNNLFVPNTKG